MATVKIYLNTFRKLKDGSYPLVLQIIKDRKKKLISLEKRINEKYWDFDNNKLRKKHPNYKRLNLFIVNKLSEIEGKIILFEEDNSDCTVDELTNYLKNKKKHGMVFPYWENIIEELKKTEKNGNANAYKNTYGVFINFRKNKDLSFKELNYKMVKQFETHLLEKGLQTNGISFHMRTVRALFNRATKDEIASVSNYPFDKYSIKTEKTMHRALSKEEVRSIRDVELKDSSLMLARDYFMFSFYNQGMNYIDMVYLQVKNLHKDRLLYRRAKTGTNFSIKLLPEAVEIIKKHIDKSKPDSFIFPAVQHKERKFREYKNAMRLTNKKLNKLGKLANCSIPLTTYVARHSWATIAKRGGISTSVISEGMGHATEHITQVYLDSFENEVVDEANKRVANLL